MVSASRLDSVSYYIYTSLILVMCLRVVSLGWVILSKVRLA